MNSTTQTTTGDTFSVHSSNWYGEKFLQLLSAIGIGDYLAQGLELKNKKRIFDFIVVPGSISIKIQLNNENTDYLNLQVKTFSEKDWNLVMETLATKSFFLANFLNNEIPFEVDSAFFNQIGKSLIPSDLNDVNLSSSCTETENLKLAGAALFWKFWEKLGEDPFIIFTMRGIGKEETISQIRKLRERIYSKYSGVHKPEKQQANQHSQTSTKSPITSEGFWNLKASIDDMRFTIKADELPASLLKRLDPLPLAGLEDMVEPLLEIAYADVARRAQAFGLGLCREGNVSYKKHHTF